jgi:hypothetical protein
MTNIIDFLILNETKITILKTNKIQNKMIISDLFRISNLILYKYI